MSPWTALSADEWALVATRTRGAGRRALRRVCHEARRGVQLSDDDIVLRAAQPELNAEQARAFCRIALHRESLYLAGAAGCGKTHTVHRAVEFMVAEDANVKIAAPTACAAHRASTEDVTGLTLHIAFNIKSVRREWSDSPVRVVGSNHDSVGEEDEAPSALTGEFPTACLSREAAAELRQVDCFFIDEVSMCDTDMMELIHRTLAVLHNEHSKPFGGVQLVFMGDFAQLPPVRPYPRPDRKIFAFEHDAFAALPVVVLRQVMRTKDKKFSEILARMRDGEATPADCAWIRSHASRRTQLSELAFFYGGPSCKARNEAFFTANNNPEVTIEPTRFCHVGAYDDPNRFTVYGDTFLGKTLVYPKAEPVRLKQGARVVCNRNVYSGSPVPIVRNGQFGTVVRFEDTRVYVKFDDTDEVVLMQNVFVRRTQNFRHMGMRVTCVCSVLPLDLGFAVTIHKAQGASIAHDVDVNPWCRRPNSSGAWQTIEGAAYTVMSRATRIENVRLLGNTLRPDAFKCNPRVKAFNKRIFG